MSEPVKAVQDAAVWVLGERFARFWLTLPCPALDGRAPLDVAREDPERVRAVLARIEDGVFVFS